MTFCKHTQTPRSRWRLFQVPGIPKRALPKPYWLLGIGDGFFRPQLAWLPWLPWLPWFPWPPWLPWLPWASWESSKGAALGNQPAMQLDVCSPGCWQARKARPHGGTCGTLPMLCGDMHAGAVNGCSMDFQAKFGPNLINYLLLQ